MDGRDRNGFIKAVQARTRKILLNQIHRHLGPIDQLLEQLIVGVSHLPSLVAVVLVACILQNLKKRQSGVSGGLHVQW